MRRIRSITPAALGIALIQSVPGLVADLSDPAMPRAPTVASGTAAAGSAAEKSQDAARSPRAVSAPARKVPSRASRGGSLAEEWATTQASWYDVRPTACFDDRGRHEVPAQARWVAHRTLPCGTTIVVATQHRTLLLEVWDRGPYHDDRDLDLSIAAFRLLAPPEQGVVAVRWRVHVPAR